MPNPIKAFFEKKKVEAKFKLAGPGQKLGDAASAAEQRQRQQQAAAAASNRAGSSKQGHQPQGAAAATAAQAALARMDVSKSSAGSDFEKKRSQAVIRAQAMKELEKEKQVDQDAARLKETYGEKPLVELEAPSACTGVFFHCPLIGDEVLPKSEMKARIREFLYSQLAEEKGLTAALIIHTFAKNAETVRRSNRVFQEKVAGVEGHDLLLEAVGFETQNLDGEDFWILPGELLPEQLDVMRSLREALVHSEPIRAEVHRDLRVLRPAQAQQSFSLPPDFFAVTAEELKREQQAKADLAEREGMLRTKAMREREEVKERRRYRYTLVRVRFPDGLVLQATFSVYEKFRQVSDLVTECLETPLPFVLHDVGGRRLEVPDYDQTLSELSLAPSALLTFAWHPEVAEEVSAQLGPDPKFLKDEVAQLQQK